MASQSALERALARLDDIEDPAIHLEQYPTPAPLAARIVHLADLLGDVEGATVFDFGTGAGVLAIGAALRRGDPVIGFDADQRVFPVAVRNAQSAGVDHRTGFVCCRIESLPTAARDVTVIMNPPFGAQHAARHADRPFLEQAARVAAVSYSIHNADSRSFIVSFADDHGGRVTHAFEAEIAIDRTHEFHAEDTAPIPVEVYRIEWQ